MEEHTKRCYKCKTDKPASEFYKDISRKDLLSTKCKDCQRVYRNLKEVPKTEKRCPKCKRTLPVSQFYRLNKGDGYQSTCIECRTESKRNEWALSNHAQYTKRLAVVYGITRLGYETLKEQQRNSCKICHISFDLENPVVDHNHLTGKVRGLLCSRCNTGLGMLQDSIEILTAASEYLLSAEQEVADLLADLI